MTEPPGGNHPPCERASQGVSLPQTVRLGPTRAKLGRICCRANRHSGSRGTGHHGMACIRPWRRSSASCRSSRKPPFFPESCGSNLSTRPRAYISRCLPHSEHALTCPVDPAGTSRLSSLPCRSVVFRIPISSKTATPGQLGDRGSAGPASCSPRASVSSTADSTSVDAKGADSDGGARSTHARRSPCAGSGTRCPGDPGR